MEAVKSLNQKDLMTWNISKIYIIMNYLNTYSEKLCCVMKNYLSPSLLLFLSHFLLVFRSVLEFNCTTRKVSTFIQILNQGNYLSTKKCYFKFEIVL